jgi:uncharacterized protein (TIRG00374 family)
VKGRGRAVLGIVVSALLVWWVLRDVNPSEVWQEVRSARWGLLILAVAVATSGFLTRSMRWKILLRPVYPATTLRSRFAAVNIGFAANNLLPARVGEFARAWSISRMEPVPVTGAFGSLVAERFLDATAILVLFGLSVWHPLFPADATVAGRPIGAVFAGVATVFFVLAAGMIALVAFPRFVVGAVAKLVGLVSPKRGELARELLGSFIAGLGALRDPTLLVSGIIWSLGIWAWNGVSFWLAMHAFGIDQGYATGLFVQAVIALGVAVPSAPGYFGTFHAAALVALHEVYGVAEDATLAFAFGYHLGGFFPVTFIGLWYAHRLGLSLSELSHSGEVVEAELHHGDPGQSGGTDQGRGED